LGAELPITVLVGASLVKDVLVEEVFPTLHKTLGDAYTICSSQSQSRNNSFTKDISYLFASMPMSRLLKRFISEEALEIQKHNK
jgi:hypothetical protein